MNLVPAVESIFRWQGEVSSDSEVLAVFKTSAERYPDLERELRRHHPYDVPEVVALPVERGSGPYLEWVCAETRS